MPYNVAPYRPGPADAALPAPFVEWLNRQLVLIGHAVAAAAAAGTVALTTTSAVLAATVANVSGNQLDVSLTAGTWLVIGEYIVGEVSNTLLIALTDGTTTYAKTNAYLGTDGVDGFLTGGFEHITLAALVTLAAPATVHSNFVRSGGGNLVGAAADTSPRSRVLAIKIA